MMKIYKYASLFLLTVTLGACQQEEITPNNTDPNVLVVEGEGGPVTLSGEMSFSSNYQDSINSESGLRDLAYNASAYSQSGQEGLAFTPSPTLTGTTTKLTCVFKNFSDASQPVSTVDIEWTNNGSNTVQLKHKDITLASGTDLTKAGWYMMAFTYTNGGASGQTFTFDKNNYKIIVSAPSSGQGSNYYDQRFLSRAVGNQQTTTSLPALFASNWVPLSAERVDGNVAAILGHRLSLSPQGQLIAVIDDYMTTGQDVIDGLGNLDTRHYLNFDSKATDPISDQSAFASYLNLNRTDQWYHNLDVDGNGTVTYGEVEAVMGGTIQYTDPVGYTWRELLGVTKGVPHETAHVTEATDITVSVPEHVVFSGAFHIWMDSPEGPEYFTNYGSYNSTPSRTASSLVFVGPNETYADAVIRMKGPTINGSWDQSWLNKFSATAAAVAAGNWNTYIFKNTSPYKSQHFIADGTDLSYVRYIWVNNVKYSYGTANAGAPANTLKLASSGITNIFAPWVYSFQNYNGRTSIYSDANAVYSISGGAFATGRSIKETDQVTRTFNNNGALHKIRIHSRIEVTAGTSKDERGYVYYFS